LEALLGTRAERMLRDTQVPLSEIAAAMGLPLISRTVPNFDSHAVASAA